jgi:hypothetical protein
VTPAPDPWTPRVGAFLATLPAGATPTAEEVLGALSEAISQAGVIRVGHVLRCLGYQPRQRREAGRRVRRYARECDTPSSPSQSDAAQPVTVEIPRQSPDCDTPSAAVAPAVDDSPQAPVDDSSSPPAPEQNRNRPALGVTRPDGVFEPDWPAGWTLDDERAWSSVVYALRPRRAAFAPFVARVAVS